MQKSALDQSVLSSKVTDNVLSVFPADDRAQMREANTTVAPFVYSDACNPSKLAKSVHTPAQQIFNTMIQCTANKVRTAALWGLHTRSRYMHDGNSVLISDAISRHGGEAQLVKQKYNAQVRDDRDALIAFLETL